jgi:hypothetical protein
MRRDLLSQRVTHTPKQRRGAWPLLAPILSIPDKPRAGLGVDYTSTGGRDVGVPLPLADIGERRNAREHLRTGMRRETKPIQGIDRQCIGEAEQFHPDDSAGRIEVYLDTRRYLDGLDYLLVAEFDVRHPEAGVDAKRDHRLPFHAADLTTISPSWDKGGIVHTLSLLLRSVA